MLWTRHWLVGFKFNLSSYCMYENQTLIFLKIFLSIVSSCNKKKSVCTFPVFHSWVDSDYTSRDGVRNVSSEFSPPEV